MYMKWRRDKTKVNVELAATFENIDAETRKELALLLPEGIDQHPRSQLKPRAPRQPRNPS